MDVMFERVAGLDIGKKSVTVPTDGAPSQLAYLARMLKTPTIGRVWEDLADHAREAILVP